MATQCPKCHSDNPDTVKFCGECGTKLTSAETPDESLTRTLETPADDLPRGALFAGRYEIIESLGTGGMGKVYKAYDNQLKEDVALKLIKPEIASDKKTLDRFSNELKIARKIVHKNVGRMYELMEDEGAFFITMEYVAGQDLKGLIRQSRQLTSGTAISITKQICEGLSEAHGLGVVHRDLKPSNIMIDKQGNARIMDFGIARSLEAKGITRAGAMVGTPEYMSPEQVEGKEVDQRSDLYSLGVILYEMVTGSVPFEGETALSVARMHADKTPPDPKAINPQISDDLSRLILRCLEKDKENRYQSAGELITELGNIEKGIPTTDRAVPKRKPLTSKEITVTFGLRKLLVPALVFIGIIIIGIVIWKLLPEKEAYIAPKIENSIAVISFKNQTGDNTYDYLQEAIPNLIITNLENTGFLYVATWERMRDLLKQMGKGDIKIISEDYGFELCRREGVESIVLGSFVKAGETFATDVKVLDVETKKLLKSASSRGEGVDSILKTQIDDLSKEISLGIGIAKQKIEAARVRVTEVTTTSMEAYNYFLRGREAQEKFYFDEAREFLEKAVELDPTFAMAFLYLSGAYDWLGDINARNDALGKAKTYSEKTTEKERLFIEGCYAADIEGNLDKYFRILKEIAEKYPKEKRIHMYLGTILAIKGMFNEAIEEYNKALELDPSHGNALNYIAYLYSEMGDYDKAIEYFQRFAAVSPGDANPFDSMGEMCLKMGKLDEAIAKYKEALEIKPDFYGSNWSLGYIYALEENYSEALKWVDQYIVMAPSLGIRAEGNFWKGFYRYWLGSLEQSLSDLHRAAELAEEVGNVFWKANVEWMKGWIHYDQEELELSRKCNETWLDAYLKNIPEGASFYKSLYSLTLGFIGLKEGQVDQAKTRLAEVKALLPDLIPIEKETFSLLIDYLHAEVLLAEGFPEKAIAVCEKTLPLGLPLSGYGSIYKATYNVPFLRDVLARAYLQNGEIDKAVMKYEQLITFNPNSKDRRLIHPKYHYRLAKLYEQQGNTGKAIEHYEKFLNLWKDADPGIAEVEDARRRLAGLKE